MKKSTRKTKLVFLPETVRTLAVPELDKVVGGWPTSTRWRSNQNEPGCV